MPEKTPGSLLPSDKSAADLLALSEAEFAKVAEDFSRKSKTNTSPEDLRKILAHEVARQQATPPTRTANTSPRPEESEDEHAETIRNALLSVMSVMGEVNISRDKEEEDKLREDADNLIRQAERAKEEKNLPPRHIRGLNLQARHKYKNAYLIQGARMLDAAIEAGTTEARAYGEVKEHLSNLSRTINLKYEADGAGDASMYFYLRFLNQSEMQELRTLGDAIVSASATPEQKDLFRRVILAAKGAFFRGVSDEMLAKYDVARFRRTIGVLADAVRDSGVYRTEVEGTSGAAERYEQGAIGGSVNFRRKQLRRGPRDVREDD